MKPVLAGLVIRGELKNWEKCRSCDCIPFDSARLHNRKIGILILLSIFNIFIPGFHASTLLHRTLRRDALQPAACLFDANATN
jgi:hypothetical protein